MTWRMPGEEFTREIDGAKVTFKPVTVIDSFKFARNFTQKVNPEEFTDEDFTRFYDLVASQVLCVIVGDKVVEGDEVSEFIRHQPVDLVNKLLMEIFSETKLEAKAEKN